MTSRSHSTTYSFGWEWSGDDLGGAPACRSLSRPAGPTQVPSELAITLRAPEVVDALNRLIAEIRVNRTGVTAIRKRLEDMSREMDDLIVTAHPTLDTEQGCGPAEAVRSLAGFAIDPAKAAALMQEMQPGASCWRSRSPTPTQFASHRPSTPPPRPRSQQPRRQASPSGE